jgi:RHS repeat-associated protein
METATGWDCAAAGVNTAYLVDTVNPTGYSQVLEELVNGAVQRVYTYGITRISQSQLINAAWATSYYGYDGQGSVRFLTGAAGTVTDHYAYDAFGNQLAAVGATPNVNRYAGEAFDAALQMTYLRARYMNPGSGRFWTMDPLGGSPFEPRSLHRYLYAGGDPIGRIDPTGLSAEPPQLVKGKLIEKFIGKQFLEAPGGHLRMASGHGAISIRKMLGFPRIPGISIPDSFPDLVDFDDHFVMEIKSIKDFQIGLGKLTGYLTLFNSYSSMLAFWNSGSFATPTWHAGDGSQFTPFPLAPCGAAGTCIVLVLPPKSGVITYVDIDLRATVVTLAAMSVVGMIAFALLSEYLVSLLLLTTELQEEVTIINAVEDVIGKAA